MSRFGRSGQPENRESFSLLVLNVSFRKQRRSPTRPLLASPSRAQRPLPNTAYWRPRWITAAGTTADDLFPLFDRYGKVLDIYIPRDHRWTPLSLSPHVGGWISNRFFFLLELASSLAGLGIREGSRSWGTITRMRRGMPLTGLMVSQGKFSSVSSTFFFLNEKAGARRLIKKNRSSYNDTIHSHNRTTARRST